MGSNVYKNTTVRINFQQVAPAATWTIAHGLGTLYPVVDCYISESGNSTRYWPDSVIVVDNNTVELNFDEALAGYATVM